MKNEPSYPGKYYVVTSPNGCTVTAKNGMQLGTVDAGKQGGFTAIDSAIIADDDEAEITQVFKLAPQQRLALLGVLGGNAGDDGGLPAGYRRVEYLQSDGGQVINTMLVPTNLTGYKAEVQLVSDGTSGYLCGVQNKSGLPGFWLQLDRMVFLMKFGEGGTRYITRNAAEVKLKYSIETNFLNSRGFVVNGEKAGINDFVYKWGHPFTLFKSRYGDGYDPTLPMKIYSWQHSEGTELVLNLVPCVNTSTGEPCLYDLVSKKPFYNSGAGDFIYPTESTTYSLRRVLPDWGKLTENGLRRLYHAPSNYKGELIDYALENGYKPIVEPEKPEVGYWSPRWTETEEEIVLEWVETEPPMEEYLTQPTE